MPRASGDRNQIQVIGRAAAILRALEHEPAGLSLAQIAQRVTLARSTVQRIVAALATEKLVAAATPDGRFRLGPALLRFASAARAGLGDLARPFIVKLSRDLRETVDLAVVQGNHLLFIDQVIGPQRLRTVSAVGETFPLTCTANGKAYLALLSDDEIAELAGLSYPGRTPHTLTDLDSVLTDIRRVRRAGIAFDREEHTLGICAAGIAFVDPDGHALAISVPVPAARFQAEEGRIANALLQTANAIAQRLESEAA